MGESKQALWGNVSPIHQYVWSWRSRRLLAIFCISLLLIVLLHVLGFYIPHLLPVELDTTMLLLSTTAEGLAALLAISLSLAFVFLQVIGGRYSLSLTRVFFDNRLEAFLIIFSLATIGTALFHLATGGRWFETPGMVALPVLVQAVFVLALFAIVFDRGVRRISGEPLVAHLKERTELYMCLYVHSLRETMIRARDTEKRMRSINVAPTLVLDADVTVAVDKVGVVQDVRMARLIRLMQRLRSSTATGQDVLRIDKNIGSPIGPYIPIRAKWNIQTEEERQTLESELIKIFKVAKLAPWIGEIKWGLDSLVAIVKKGVQDSETPLVKLTLQVIGGLLTHYIEGTNKLGIALPPDIVDKQLHSGPQQSLEYGIDLIADLIEFAARAGEVDPMLVGIYELARVGEDNISFGDYGGVKQVNYGFRRAYLAARKHQNDLLFHRVRYYLDRNFGAALKLLKNKTPSTTIMHALGYIMRDIAGTVSELTKYDVDSRDVQQFKASLRTLQELFVGAPQVGLHSDDDGKRSELLQAISDWIQGSIFQLSAYLFYRVHKQEIGLEIGQVFLGSLNSGLGSLEQAYRQSLETQNRFWFWEDTKQVVFGKPYLEQQQAYVLLVLYRLSKGESLNHISKSKDFIEFAKFVTDMLGQIEKDAGIWGELLSCDIEKLAGKLQAKYKEVVEDMKWEVSQLSLSEDKVNAMKMAIARGARMPSLGREIAKVVIVEQKAPANLKPLQRRVSLPRLYLVDSPYHSPPDDFPDFFEYDGRALKSFESSHVVAKVADTLHVRRKNDEKSGRLILNRKTVRETKKQLSTEGYHPDVLLIGDRASLWSVKGFQASNSKDIERIAGFEGTIEGLRVFWDQMISKNKAVVLDSKRMVQVEVFSELTENSVDIVDHYEEDGNQEKRNESERSDEEKVLVAASELIRISLLDDNAGRVVPID